MKNKFVFDGPGSFLRAKRAMEAESVEKKYAAELENATPDQKARIQELMAAELAQRKKALNHKPSPATLW